MRTDKPEKNLGMSSVLLFRNNHNKLAKSHEKINTAEILEERLKEEGKIRQKPTIVGNVQFRRMSNLYKRISAQYD